MKSAVNKNGYYAISCITKFSVRQIFKKKQRSAKKGMILRHLSRSLRFVRPDKTSQPMKMKIENNRDTQNKTIVAWYSGHFNTQTKNLPLRPVLNNSFLKTFQIPVDEMKTGTNY